MIFQHACVFLFAHTARHQGGPLDSCDSFDCKAFFLNAGESTTSSSWSPDFGSQEIPLHIQSLLSLQPESFRSPSQSSKETALAAPLMSPNAVTRHSNLDCLSYTRFLHHLKIPLRLHTETPWTANLDSWYAFRKLEANKSPAFVHTSRAIHHTGLRGLTKEDIAKLKCCNASNLLATAYQRWHLLLIPETLTAMRCWEPVKWRFVFWCSWFAAPLQRPHIHTLEKRTQVHLPCGIWFVDRHSRISKVSLFAFVQHRKLKTYERGPHFCWPELRFVPECSQSVPYGTLRFPGFLSGLRLGTQLSQVNALGVWVVLSAPWSPPYPPTGMKKACNAAPWRLCLNRLKPWNQTQTSSTSPKVVKIVWRSGLSTSKALAWHAVSDQVAA